MSQGVISGKLASFRTFIGLAPKEYPRVIPKTYDFAAQSSYVQDLTVAQETDKIEWLQSIYVDNSNNANSLSITIAVTGQLLTWPPYSQGYLPVLSVNPPSFTIATSGSLVIAVQLLTFAVPAIIWNVNNLINTNEKYNYSAINASGLIKSGAGVLGGILCTSVSGSASIVVYDNTSGSGTQIVNSMALTAGTPYPIPAAFSTGCYIAITGTATMTVFYN